MSDGGVAFFTLFVVENTLFREDAALFTLFVVVFTLSEICSSFYLVFVEVFLPCLHIKMCQMGRIHVKRETVLDLKIENG